MKTQVPRMLLGPMLAAAMSAGGCRGHDAAAPPQPAPIEVTPELVEQSTAHSAAPLVVAMPSAEARVEQEVLLHAALYRASHQTNAASGHTKHFLLQPVEEANPIDLGVEPEEFRLRVLAALDDLGAPVAWLPETWRTHDVNYFPGTSEPATRLRIKITRRDEDQATIVGEVGDWTATVGGSRQGITATWDGRRWNIDRDRVRLVW